jgi:cell division inhibitor SulA
MFLSGLTALDQSTGNLAPGSLVELGGVSDSGKTALALWYCRSALLDPEACVGWVQVENLLTETNLRWAGVDLDRIVVARQSPDLPGLDLAREMIEGGCSVVVVDSIAALSAGEESSLVATLGMGIPVLKEAAQEHQALVLLTNQDRTVHQARGLRRAGSSPVLARFIDCHIRLTVGEGRYRAGEKIGCKVHFKVVSGPGAGTSGRFNMDYSAGLFDLRT